MTSVLALASVVAPASAADPDLASPVYDGVVQELTDSEAEAVRFRGEMGLANDIALVREAANSASYDDETYGIPLNADETAELLRRAAIQWEVGNVVEQARKKPSFGGAYLDQLAGGMPVFLFTEVTANDVSDLTDALPDGTEFRLQLVERSEADLFALQQRVNVRWRELEREGIDVNSTGIDDMRNAVVVGVGGLTDEAARDLETEFGPGIIVRDQATPVADACNSVHDCRPIKGGLEIFALPTEGECTSGYIVRRISNAKLYQLTAGHCFGGNGGLDVKWGHNLNIDPDVAAFGWSKVSTWLAGASRDADVGLTSISADEEPTNKNEIYVGGGVVHKVVSYTPASSQVQNGVALMFGQTSGDKTGTILLRNVANDSPLPNGQKMVVLKTMEVSFNPDLGDSGGPVFYPAPSGGVNRIALGTHVHSDAGSNDATGDGWYSPIDTGFNTVASVAGATWNYFICSTAAC